MAENRNSLIFKLPSQFSKAGSTNSFNFNDAFPSASLFAKKMKLCVNGSYNKENDNNDCNGIRTDNHLIRKQTVNHLAKLAK